MVLCQRPRFEDTMKIAFVIAFSALCIVSAAQAGQNHHPAGSLATTCDNSGRCTTFNATTRPPAAHKVQRQRRRATAPTLDTNGNMAGVVISHNTGAHTHVGAAYVARFQAYIDDLENNYGAKVLFMGGIRRGRCSIYSEHPCGKALDVCQLRRGVVDPRCHLPNRAALGRIAASHGLFEGGRWCDSDYGHAQVGVTAPACGDRHIFLVRH